MMLRNIDQLYGTTLGATDGEIGHVKDFLFDDKSWLIRYLVVDTGTWLTGRKVFLSKDAFDTHALGKSENERYLIRVNLSRKQIEESPTLESYLPVSRQHEEDYYRYYGWPSYWQDNAAWSGAGLPIVVPPPSTENTLQQGPINRDDLHLQSTTDVTGCRIEATDGSIGTVSGFILDPRTWDIKEVTVETGHWYAGRTILLHPKNVIQISYKDSAVFVNLTKEELLQDANRKPVESVNF